MYGATPQNIYSLILVPDTLSFENYDFTAFCAKSATWPAIFVVFVIVGKSASFAQKINNVYVQNYDQNHKLISPLLEDISKDAANVI